MNLNEYQQAAMTTCIPTAENFAYMMLNLVSEVGELASKAAKAIRKDQAAYYHNELCVYPPNQYELANAMRAEAGDVLWQIAGLCHVMGWNLEDVAKQNLDKLRDRQNRQVIIGDGDNR
ncbi:MAG: nucleoside triphosphate pyrophosphohydrolase family protein [Bacteroides cellulosilyticus]|nr:nucleoside triphosphate pyrophosphohydrolase family protein [Bacteroides cellulosilyticus]